MEETFDVDDEWGDDSEADDERIQSHCFVVEGVVE